MKSKLLPVITTSLLAAPSLLNADTITMTGASGSAWTDGTTWSDALPPSSTNDYVVSGKTLNAPTITNGGTATFEGQSLSVTGGGLSFPGSSSGNYTHTYDFPNLVGPIEVTDSTLTFSSSNSTTKVFNGALNFTGNNVISRTTSNYTHNQNFMQPITGTGTLTFNFTGGGTGRAVNVNGSGNNFTGAVILNNTQASGGNAPPLNINQPLGASSYEIRNRWVLVNAVAGGIDSANAITLVNTASQLTLTQPWNNPAAALTITDGTVLVGNAMSEIGSLSGAAGKITGNGLASALKVNQSGNETYAGSLGFTAGNALAFTKAGTGDLLLGGVIDPAIPFTVTEGGLGMGSSTVASVTQTGGALLMNLGTDTNDHTVVTGDYDSSGGGIRVVVNSPPVLGSDYTLLSYQGSMTGTPALEFSGLGGSRVTPSVDYGTGSNSSITVTFSGEPASLVWNGVPGGAWDIDSSGNWDNAGSADNFFQFDTVTFDDSATGTTSVVLGEEVAPGSVAFDNSTKDYTISGSGSIGGVTGLTKSGTGTVTIATDNTNTGATVISEGTLQVGNGGTTGSLGSGEVVNEGVLSFNRSDEFTFANFISGSGAVSQDGSGTTILTADNTYFGATTIGDGTLQVGDGGATGTLGDTSEIINNGTLAFSREGELILPQVISGTGGLVQNGPGTVILEADATYTGGTTINGGSLQIGNDDVFGSVVGAVTNNGNLTVSRFDDIDFNNTVTGTGSFTHAGFGALRLTGTKTYTGETRVVQGILDIDSGSNLPAGGSFAFLGGNGLLRISDAALTTLPGFRSVGSGVGANVIESDTPITVTGGDLLVGPDADSSHYLDLSYIPSFTYDAPAQTVSIGSQSPGGDTRNATFILPDTASLTSNALNIQTANGATTPSNAPIASGTLELAETTTIHTNTINMGFNRDSASIVQPFDAMDPVLTIRAADGTGRTNINMGNRGTAYGATQFVTIDLLTNVGGTATLDALVGTLKIGDYGRGAGQIQNASFLMGGGTLDATEIILGNIYNNNGNNGVLNATLTVEGGSVLAPTVNFGSRTNGALNSTVNLYDGGSLSSTLITAGSGDANRVLNLSSGTLSNISGSDLDVSGIKVMLETQADASLAVSAGDLAYFGPGTNFEFHYDSSLTQAGKLTVTGDAEIDGSTTVLTLVDDNFAPESLTVGQKFVLIDYASGSFTGAFTDAANNSLPDGATVGVGSQFFVLDYDDAEYGGKAVTLTVPEGGNYATWAAFNAGGGLPDGDHDQDGVPNAVEYFMGETGSSFTPTPAIADGKVTWPKDPTAAATYEVQTSTTLAAEGQPGGWETVSTGVLNNADSVEYTIPTGGLKNFVRLKVTVP